LDEWERVVRGELGQLVFGVDGESMESVVLDLLRRRGLSLGLAESVTGGLVAARLTAVPGASDVLRGSIVSYASGVKFELLRVPPGPVVTADAAAAMAAGARVALGADVGLALTGVAGPAEQEGVSVGTVHVGIESPRGAVSRSLRLGRERDQVRQFAVISALDLLRRHLA
jgi:nicotinamide-nucleotide amidase